MRALVLEMPVVEVPITYRPRVTGATKISGTIKGTLMAATILVSTVVRLYLSEFWQILTVPASLILPKNGGSNEENVNMDNLLDDQQRLLAGKDFEKGQVGENQGQSTFGSRKIIVPLESGGVSGGQRYPGYPVLAEGSYTSAANVNLEHDKGKDEGIRTCENICLSDEENKQWKRQRTARHFVLITVSAFLLVYGAAMAAMYNDPKEQRGGTNFAKGAIMMGASFLLMQILPAMPTKWFWYDNVCDDIAPSLLDNALSCGLSLR